MNTQRSRVRPLLRLRPSITISVDWPQRKSLTANGSGSKVITQNKWPNTTFGTDSQSCYQVKARQAADDMTIFVDWEKKANGDCPKWTEKPDQPLRIWTASPAYRGYRQALRL